MTTLSTHVLDTGAGTPASGLAVHLSRRSGEGWDLVAEGLTDDDGRFGDFGEMAAGTYRLVFETGEWGNTFYPFVAVVFVVAAESDHLHVPLLISPYGYTTYRGS